MTIITLNDLSIAITKILDINRNQAKNYATTIMDFFGFEDRIIDNVLTPEERRLFYMLQENGILSAERAEMTLPNGNQWRTHYWILEKKTILQYSNEKTCDKKVEPEEDSCTDIYSNITKDMWAARKKPTI